MTARELVEAMRQGDTSAARRLLLTLPLLDRPAVVAPALPGPSETRFSEAEEGRQQEPVARV